MLSPEQEKALIDSAREAREKAYAPYSKYRVGAAVIAASGKYYSSANVENAALTPTVHAEVNAVNAAVAAGERKFAALAVVTDNDPPPFPCALCRQSLAEFDDGSMAVIAANPAGMVRRTTLKELYPEPFGSKQLGIDPTRH